MNLQQRGSFGGAAVDMVGAAKTEPMSFTSPSCQAQGQHFQNPSGNHLGSDHPQPQQLESVQNFQQQYSVPHSQQQQQLRGGLGNAGSIGPVKLEPQMGPSDQNGPMQQLQMMRGIRAVKMEPQQLQSLRNMGSIKMEHQHSDQSMFQQQQQQQFLQLSRQSSQAAAAQLNLLQHQRILQIQQQQQQDQQQQQQHQQQQQMLKTLLQQRTQLQQQLHPNSLSVRAQVKPNIYEPGTCARRLTQYMYHQQHRPEDSNIEFWRKFVAEYFAPNGKKRWCVSLYGSGRQTTGVFSQICSWEFCARGHEELIPRRLLIPQISQLGA